MNMEEQEELELIDFNDEAEKVGRAKESVSNKEERERRQNQLENGSKKPGKTEKKTSLGRELLSWILTFAVAIAVALLLKNYVIINANVPTGSMTNTIMEHDNIFGNRLAYMKEGPQRGDIIIFRYPDDESQKYIKRVIGLPGETVIIEEGQIFIDGSETPLQEDYLKEAWVLNNDGYRFDVPEGCYLVLGDNRNNSKDSRYWNNTYVTDDQIIGEAVCVYFPFSHMKWLNE